MKIGRRLSYSYINVPARMGLKNKTVRPFIAEVLKEVQSAAKLEKRKTRARGSDSVGSQLAPHTRT